MSTFLEDKVIEDTAKQQAISAFIEDLLARGQNIPELINLLQGSLDALTKKQLKTAEHLAKKAEDKDKDKKAK